MRTIEVVAATDELGEPEKFTRDLFPLVADEMTDHLQEGGLPNVGTIIKSGMIVVGKRGKSSLYPQRRKPNAFEIHCLDQEALKSQFGELWIDSSYYATEEDEGVVVSAEITCTDGKKAAIVKLIPGNSDSPKL